MYVSEIMTNSIITIAPNETAARAAQIMSEQNVGALPIAEQKEVVGILTDRDIVLRCVAKNLDPQKVSASEIMSRSAVCVSPMHTIDDVVRIMSNQQIRRLPVCDNGKPVGMVCMADVARVRHGLEAAEAICEISKP